MTVTTSDDPATPSASAALPANPPESAPPERSRRRPIRCDCGRELLVKVDRARVILRCPVHGIQFRYTASGD